MSLQGTSQGDFIRILNFKTIKSFLKPFIVSNLKLTWLVDEKEYDYDKRLKVVLVAEEEVKHVKKPLNMKRKENYFSESDLY